MGWSSYRASQVTSKEDALRQLDEIGLGVGVLHAYREAKLKKSRPGSPVPWSNLA